jgi:hypothetical protein
MYLHPDRSLSPEPPAESAPMEFAAMGDGLHFTSEPLSVETEFTGPLASKLWVSSTTADADLFLTFRVFDPAGDEVTFQGALDPHTPIAQGWLRASHRALDQEISTRWRPYHTHAEQEPLEPGEVYELDIELWPTSIVVPAGYTVGLSVRGRDYEYGGDEEGSIRIASFKNQFTGVGPFIHDDPRDRPADVFGGTTSLHLGPDQAAYVLVPVI